MKFKVEKNGNSVNFMDAETNEKFDYIKFADNLYDGNEVEIVNYGSLTDEEIRVINETIKELNSLANPRTRKRIISQLDIE